MNRGFSRSRTRRLCLISWFIVLGLLIWFDGAAFDLKFWEKLGPNGRRASTAPLKLSEDRTQSIVKLKTLAVMLARNELTSARISDVIGGGLQPTENREYLILEGSGYKVVVQVQGSGADSRIREVTLYPDDSWLKLRLVDLEAQFKRWTLLHQSKSSSVRFDYIDPESRGGAEIFVELLFPPSDPSSPVLSLTMRPAKPAR